MELSVKHTTSYEYNVPIENLIQTTKLYPSENNALKIINWNVTRDGSRKSKIYTDGEGNIIQSFSNKSKVKSVNFFVNGKVETFDTKGIYNNPLDKINPIVYLRNTTLTQSDSAIIELAHDAKNGTSKNHLDVSHELLRLVAERVEYKPLTTSNETTAIVAYSQKKGVCQDQAHIMISAARSIGIPARYVNGYMHNNSHSSEFQSTHAWAEFYIENLGWVGFDPTNNCSPDERYIRVSCGLDANYAAPIKGVFYGRSNSNGSIEKLKISVQTLEYNSQQ